MRRAELSIKDFVLASLLVGVGFVLHAVFPGILGGMKPDFALVMLFLVIILIKDPRIVVMAGVITGILTALTTSFPAGQIPNIVDKIVTTAFVLGLTRVVPKKAYIPIIGILGTLVSGTVFLGTALTLTGLPASFLSLMMAVVLPATVINTIALGLLYPLANRLYQMQEERLTNLVPPQSVK